MRTRRATWLRQLPARPRADLQLICFPHAGGAASTFHGWADLLPASIEIIAVQYPGRQDRYEDPLIPDLIPLADELAEIVQPVLSRPTALFGHSMGATVAYEVARRLEPRFPSPLVGLFVSARKAPSAGAQHGLPVSDEQIRGYVRLLGGTGAALTEDDDLWQLALPALRHDLGLVHRYRHVPGAPLACPIVAFAGDQDHTVSPADTRLWARHTVNAFREHVLPGGHFYLTTALRELTTVLADDLRDLTTPRTGEAGLSPASRY
jgi:surfactin synthase thioesterase subunit